MTAFNRRELRDAFGAYPTGVTVVTALSADGRPVGFTANSFTSVSLEPPILLVCPARSLSSFEVFSKCTAFCVNVLAADQEDVSNLFAGFNGDRFGQIDWEPDMSGIPLISGAAAHFSCATRQIIDAGDHIVLMGGVTYFTQSGDDGLAYARGRYASVGAPLKHPANGQDHLQRVATPVQQAV